MSKTLAATYHGGTASDEIAALLSLCLGVRLKAGNHTRLFQPDKDPRGAPWSFREYGLPDPLVPRSTLGPTIPRLRRELDLDEAPALLYRFPELAPSDSVVLVRAARLYQEGVWISESEPALAWLMLVAAVEAGAQQWGRRERLTPRERIRRATPALDDLLAQIDGDIADAIAGMLAGIMKATQKFVDFCTTFMPSPPDHRPPERFQLLWEESELREALRLMYNYRSRALHDGTPFPWPMSWQPGLFGEENTERPFSSSGGRGGIWRAEDIPLTLHAFEHIARNVLLNWWASLLPQESTND
jgi:hypothetical protein